MTMCMHMNAEREEREPMVFSYVHQERKKRRQEKKRKEERMRKGMRMKTD